MNKLISLLLTILFSVHSIHSHGFCAGTLIRSAQGYATIEDQSVGKHVQSLNGATQYCLQQITHITKTKAHCFVRIWVDGEYLDTSPDQLFYLAHEKIWIPAKHLTTQSILTKNISQELLIDDIEVIQQDTELYSITIANDHTFFVTRQQILTHNMVPIVIGFSIAFGGGFEFLSASVGIGALGLLFGFKFYNDKTKKELRLQRLENSSTTPTINAKTLAAPIEPRKSGCGNKRPSMIEDRVLIAPIQKPKEPNRGCYNPVPVPKRKQGCGSNQQQKAENFIVKQEAQTTEKQKPSTGTDAQKQKIKTVDDILKDAKPGRKTNGPTKQFEKPGNYNTALQDFYSLGLADVKSIKTGKLGKSPDGRIVNVRIDSTDGRPTLEIYNPKTEKSLKIRYGDNTK